MSDHRTFTTLTTQREPYRGAPPVESFDRHTAAMNDGTRMHIDIFEDRVRIIAESRTGRYGQPITLSDLGSCAVTIRPANEPPLRGYRGTDDGLRVPTAPFEPKTSVLLWPRESTILAERLDQMELGDAETGERFTASRIDDAIQSAVESFNAMDDVRVINLTTRVWLAIRNDVALHLDIDPTTLEGVTL